MTLHDIAQLTENLSWKDAAREIRILFRQSVRKRNMRIQPGPGVWYHRPPRGFSEHCAAHDIVGYGHSKSLKFTECASPYSLFHVESSAVLISRKMSLMYELVVRVMKRVKVLSWFTTGSSLQRWTVNSSKWR